MILLNHECQKPYSSLHCIIPARSGSKGLPSKNSRVLHGLPLAEHSLKFALSISGLDSIILSTDCPYLLSRANLYSSALYHERSPELSSDTASIVDLVLDIHNSTLAITAGSNPAYLVLQPTSPFRSHSEVASALSIAISKGLSSLVAVTSCPHHPSECINLSESGWKYVVPPPATCSRRQDYANAPFFISGSFYLATLSFLLENRSFLGDQSSFFQTFEPVIVDIDDLNDFNAAHSLYSFMRQSGYAL